MSRSVDADALPQLCGARAAELLLDDGWAIDTDAPPPDGHVFLGSFVKPMVPEFVATVDFMLESGPTVSNLLGPDRIRAVVGGELGVRHLPTAARLRSLDCETNISIDIAELFDEEGLALPAIEDERSAHGAAAVLADASKRYGAPFARDHSSLDAMIAFVRDGGRTCRTERFAAIFVPVAMFMSGRAREAREAIDGYRSAFRDCDEREEYEALIPRLEP